MEIGTAFWALVGIGIFVLGAVIAYSYTSWANRRRSPVAAEHQEEAVKHLYRDDPV